ncbi:ATP-binding protein [Streptomyces sp. NPDC047002]|uniref:ATP-binding protein n=1 Tax=Streptomyces sp. NPDC047002 TaxID=3155475 RepID=UPI0034511EA8
MTTEPGETPRVSRIRIGAVPSAAGEARAFVGRVLRGWRIGEAAEDAQLIVSELVTNAVRAVGDTAAGPTTTGPAALGLLGIQLRLRQASLFVEVWDRSDERPVLQSPDTDAEGGRGLLLVEMLSSRFGVYPSTAGGKVVWSEISVKAGPSLEVGPDAEPLPPPAQQPTVAGSSAARRQVDDALLERASGRDTDKDLPDWLPDALLAEHVRVSRLVAAHRGGRGQLTASVAYLSTVHDAVQRAAERSAVRCRRLFDLFRVSEGHEQRLVAVDLLLPALALGVGAAERSPDRTIKAWEALLRDPHWRVRDEARSVLHDLLHPANDEAAQRLTVSQLRAVLR